MLKHISLLILIITGLASCDQTYSYSVYVENATGEDLEVAFKSVTDERGNIEEKVNIPNGEKKLIIKNATVASEGDDLGTSSKHCKFVAEYVMGTIQDSISSNIEWCSDKVVFQKTDIEEGEFLIKYTTEDF